MRIVHTADWHIGQTLAGHARDHEHREVLAALATIVARCEADALLIAGDVFDHQHPSGEAQAVFFGALKALRAARPRMTIVVTAGNHDAAGRLAAPQPLLELLNVHVVGNVRWSGGRLEAARHIVPLADARGEVAARVLAVSYPTAACLPAGRTPGRCQTRQLYAALLEECGAPRDGLPLVMTGHLHVAGGLASEGCERRIMIGGEEAVSHEAFPPEAAYVALGHLHRAQAVGGRDTVRYSGSLLPLSATELDYAHGVTLVTLEGGIARSERIPLPRPVPFLRLPCHGETRLAELGDRLRALDIPADLPPERRPFVQVWLAHEDVRPGYRAELDRIADGFAVRLVEPRAARPPEAAGGTAAAGYAAVRLAELRPEDLFRQAFERAHKLPPAPAHIAAFRAALASAEA